MSGDLSITTQPARQDLAAGASRAPALRAASQGAARTAPATLEATVASDPGQQAEAARLKALLTDPEMRVSTHHDEASGRTVLEVQSRETGDLVEQIPSETLLRLYATMREPLFDEHA